MKKLLICIGVTAMCASVKAQDDSASMRPNYNISNNASGNSNYKKSIWSIAINPSLPIGHFKTLSSFGIGGYLGWEYKTSKNFGITLNAGYISYKGKTKDTIKYSNFNYVPLLAGAKFYTGGGGFYIHAEMGAGFGSSGLGTSFWYGAGLGDKISNAIDMELKYVGWHQHIVNTTYSSGGAGAGGGGAGGGGGYGGHYSTIDLRIAFTF